MNYGCEGKRAVISGGSSGIGLAAAKTLLADGAEVWLLARHEQPQLLAELQNAYADKVHFIACDVSRVSDCQNAAAQIKKAGAVDFLVNSAGIYSEQSMEMLTEQQFDEIFNVNVKGTVFLTQALLPHFAAAGAVVNVASDAGISGNYGCAAYCASKGAVVAFTRALALDTAPRLRVNCVCPADVDTPLLEKQLEAAGGSYTIDDVAEAYPMGRVGKAEEIAHVICSLLSPANSFMTGSIIAVDGGLTAK